MKEKKDFPFWLFPTISWILSAYFLGTFHLVTGFPKQSVQTPSDWIWLGFGVILVFLPFFSRVKIGDLIEVERKIEKVEKEFGEFKAEIHNLVQTISLTVSAAAISRSQATNTVILAQDRKDAVLAYEDVAKSRRSSSREAEEIKQEILLLDDEDNIMPLARIRIRIEQLLRQILDKKLSSSKISQKDMKYLSARDLFREFVSVYPQYKNLDQSFDYVNRVCNAAVHGQNIPTQDVAAVLDIGSGIIAILHNIANSEGSN